METAAPEFSPSSAPLRTAMFAKSRRSAAPARRQPSKSVVVGRLSVALRRRRTLGPVLAVSRMMPGARWRGKTFVIASIF